MPKYTVLDAGEIEEALSDLPDWKVVGNKLSATFHFSSFKNAIAFINLVAVEAEVQNHHPEWQNSFKKVEMQFCTQDVGNKITDLDVKLARFSSNAAFQTTKG